MRSEPNDAPERVNHRNNQADPTRPSSAKRLRRLIRQDEILVLPGVADPMSARVAESVGFSALFASGAGISNLLFGYPDIGLVTGSEMADAISRIAAAIEIPLMADGDNGYGGIASTYRLVERYAAVGIGGVLIEDQTFPKRCGHFDGKGIIEVPRMIEKLVAAREAASQSDMVLVARTDAIAVEGFGAAVKRAQLYDQAGADLIFVEAPESLEQLALLPREIDAPLVANMVEGGRTPLLSAQELQELGYRAAIFANYGLRVAMHAMRSAFQSLLESGDSRPKLTEMLTWEERQGFVRYPEWLALEQAVDRTVTELKVY